MEDRILENCLLFRGIPAGELPGLLAAMGARRKFYQKGEVILSAGEPARAMGVVLSGRVQIENNDFWGNKTILDSLEPGAVFAETYACLPEVAMLASAVSAADSRVLFLDPDFLSPDQGAGGAGRFRERLSYNLLQVSVRKNLSLSQRSFHTAPKSIRARVLSYLSDQAVRQGSGSFTIPFSRQELAEYLNVDRSALSKELGKLRDEGLLEWRKNRFRLKEI